MEPAVLSHAEQRPRRFGARMTGARQRSVSRGQRIYVGNASGTAWRVLSGSVRLDRAEQPNGEQSFANLAVRGDIIGAETLLFGKYSFTATALADCLLVPWPDDRTPPAGDYSLLRTLAKAERRAAEVIALRCGQAADRVRRLVMMLAQAPAENPANQPADLQVVLPSRQDMADITALTLETVSRMVSQLRHAGLLAPLRQGKHPSQRNFFVRPIAGDP